MATNKKKILVSQLRLGMFIDGFDGSWLASPFWRSRFLLSDPAKLQAVLACGITECWIDIARGDDVAAEPPAPAAPAAPLPPPADAPRAEVPGAVFERELAAASALCGRARAATLTMFQQARMGNAVDTSQCVALVEEIVESVSGNQAALISLARLKTKDDYTYMHSVAVCALMAGLAQALGRNAQDCREAGLAGLLHDIGKCGVPLDILNKPGKLSDSEFDEVRQHPQRGYTMLSEAGSVSAAVADVCLHHHEKFDGNGYPHRLKGDGIALLARMGAVCDVYDAITSDRPYKAGWDPSDSVAQMLSWKGHFDPQVLGAFVKMLGIYPTGALVRLKSGRLAVVLEQNPGALTKPTVKVFYSVHDDCALMPALLDLSAPGAGDMIEGREPRARWPGLDIEAVWAGKMAPRRAALPA